MGSIFSKKPKEPASRVTEQDRAVLQLKQQRDKLKMYIRRLEGSLEKDRLLAKKLIHESKVSKAKLLLRKKRYTEQLIERASAQLDNVERLTCDIEQAQLEMSVMDRLAQGNECLKNMHRMMSIEDVEKILAETQDSIEYQREIDDILSGALTNQDEEDVLAELQGIIDAEQRDITLPSVPEDKLPTPEARTEPALPKREKSAAIPVLAS